jgi:hypothetical protein
VVVIVALLGVAVFNREWVMKKNSVFKWVFREVEPASFSHEGFLRLKERIDEFGAELVSESTRVSKRHQADSVSPAYVDRAAEHLALGKPCTWRRLLGGLGGLVLGVGFASAGSMIQQNSYSTRGVLLSLVCIILGLPAFMYHVMKE